MGDCDSGGAYMAVELEAGLNADSDPTSEFVTQGEKKNTGHIWTCTIVTEANTSLGTNAQGWAYL